MKAKRKDAAMLGKAKHKRLTNDAYDTIDPDVAIALHKHVDLRDVVYDPACGEGMLLVSLAQEGHVTRGSDIEPRGEFADVFRKRDFLDLDELPPEVGCIVTNPPYLDALSFILQARHLTAERQGQFAMLLRNEYDCAAGRRELFRGHPFHKKIVLTWRPRWFAYKPGDASPRHNYAWYVWDWRYLGQPQIEYAMRISCEDGSKCVV